MTAPAMAVTERPILFSAAPVRAILDGRKTQTRRVVANPHAPDTDRWVPDAIRTGLWMPDAIRTGLWMPVYANRQTGPWQRCPYGQPGDRLWVRETWAPFEYAPGVVYRADADGNGSVPYLSSGAGGLGGGVCHYRPPRWRPSIHMPRWASRLTLEITGVRVERVQAISEEDARAEGMEFMDAPDGRFWSGPVDGVEYWQTTARTAFALVWDSPNASRGHGWDANPWVFVIEFRRVAA